MDENVFMAALVGAALLLAFWCDLRFGGLRPSGPSRRIVHAAVAYVVLQVAVAVVGKVDHGGELSPAMLVAVLAVFLPALVYSFLTGMWLLRTLAEATSAAR